MRILNDLTLLLTPFLVATAPLYIPDDCPSYDYHAKTRHEAHRSAGRHALPFQRPIERCRTYISWEVEDKINQMRTTIKDPDLFRLFENSFPNTLDTMIKWKGFAMEDDEETDEDLAFVITGDINAMWLRDSANQILSYAPVLTRSSSPVSLAALFRGVINAQSRYIKFSPYCHAYQPLPESGVAISHNGAYFVNKVNPSYDQKKTFDCKWELDSLGSFLELSSTYYNITGDIRPFTKYTWLETLEVILDAVDKMRVGTYSPEGQLVQPGYTMYGQTNRATETTSNNGHGNPVTRDTGLIRSTFRPSDDATIFQFLIPSNMHFASQLSACLSILSDLDSLDSLNLAMRVGAMAKEIRAGIATYGIINHPVHGQIYAFEVDGYGSQNLMDDANMPSLLGAPLYNYVNATDPVYLSTRRFALSEANPYWAHGPVFSAIGGPHLGPMKGWPIASIVRVMTSEDASGEEARQEIKGLLGTTAGLGLMHESINAHDEKEWTRHWFGWANGLFGEMIMKVEEKWGEGVLGASYQ